MSESNFIFRLFTGATNNSTSIFNKITYFSSALQVSHAIVHSQKHLYSHVNHRLISSPTGKYRNHKRMVKSMKPRVYVMLREHDGGYLPKSDMHNRCFVHFKVNVTLLCLPHGLGNITDQGTLLFHV